MKYVVTGSNGALGTDLVKELKKREFEVLKGTRDNLNITDRDLVFKTITDYKPDVIIHPAAYTQVDMCESMEEYAMNVNGYGTKNIVDAANEVGAKIIYTSSDYVFDGTKKDGKSYLPNDETNPLSVYGKSKLLGEEFTKENDKHFIVRTSWVYGSIGKNFVRTMLSLSEKLDVINVVDDQIGSPTYTVDLAKILVDMSLTEKYGTYHATNLGYISWAKFAEEIFRIFEKNTKVNKITTDEYLNMQDPNKSIAPRPMNSRLSKECLRDNGFELPPHYLDALRRYKEEISPKPKTYKLK